MGPLARIVLQTGSTGPFALRSSRGADASFEEFILVLKCGSLTPRWAAFLIDTVQLVDGSADGFSGQFYGMWSSEQHAVSHASLFVRDGSSDCGPSDPDCNPPEVVEPGTLALMGLGLAGRA